MVLDKSQNVPAELLPPECRPVHGFFTQPLGPTTVNPMFLNRTRITLFQDLRTLERNTEARTLLKRSLRSSATDFAYIIWDSLAGHLRNMSRVVPHIYRWCEGQAIIYTTTAGEAGGARPAGFRRHAHRPGCLVCVCERG